MARLHANGPKYACDDATNGSDATHADCPRQYNDYNAIDAASANASSYHDSRAASQRAENAGVDGLLEAPWTRPSTGCFPKSPRVLQEGWSTSKEGSANSRKSLGRSQRHLRSSSPGTYEPDIIMEHFPDRCGSYMARVRPPVSKSGSRASGEDSSCSRSLHFGKWTKRSLLLEKPSR